MSLPARIAMWSGPRNISTALMRSWEARRDTYVCDEPLYAHYLSVTATDHPGREEIVAAGETDWRKVAEWLTGDVPEEKPIFYQKHMAHHLFPEMRGPWLEKLRHAFLLRDPREMLISLGKVMEKPTVQDTGLPQQWDLFQLISDAPVIDSRDVLNEPRTMLRKLCQALDVPFTERMLTWEPGPRATDGIWAKYWYDSVYTSTEFRPYKPTEEPLPEHLMSVYEECLSYYEKLAQHRLIP